jgi:hypothetical protein
MALIKLFWNYVICGRGELPPPQRKPPSRFAIWQSGNGNDIEIININGWR